jgi:hypothetical protein
MILDRMAPGLVRHDRVVYLEVGADQQEIGALGWGEVGTSRKRRWAGEATIRRTSPGSPSRPTSEREFAAQREVAALLERSVAT